jgi:molybdopterin-dependent oxidoreductase alpha subunit
MIAQDWVDHNFIDHYTSNFEAVKTALDQQTWPELEQISGTSQAEMQRFAAMLGAAQRAVFVWSMGITQHTCGEENVRAIVNLALSKGFVGREGCGLMPIRGHSGVQGGAEMGCYATVFPGGQAITPTNAAQLSEKWGFEVPEQPGLIAPQMIDAAHRGELDVLFTVGGNFLEVLPEPDYVEGALAKVPLRVHFDIICSSQMLVDPAETVIVLPATTRYEIPGGVTETSTERRVIFSPEIPGPRIGEARPEWQVFTELAQRVRSDLAYTWANTAAIRAEIAQVVPFYAGIQHLLQAGDQFQYGGNHLCFGWNFPTADGKAHFSVITPTQTNGDAPLDLQQGQLPPGYFRVATRRGKQFNSMVQARKDAITGAQRQAILINPADAAQLGLQVGDKVLLSNQFGSYQGELYLAPIKPGNLQVHWPEGNVLLDRQRRSQEGVPDYNAVVQVSKA